jgi:hypothetical protein
MKNRLSASRKNERLPFATVLLTSVLVAQALEGHPLSAYPDLTPSVQKTGQLTPVLCPVTPQHPN